MASITAPLHRPAKPIKSPLRRAAASRARALTGGARMRPGFLIIGAQKAGTTSLYDYLTAHPEVGPPWRKEVHYFSNFPQRSERWYLGHFPRVSVGYRITGEATPYYLFHPFVPERVARLLPDVKLVALLRDPVARAVSHHNYLHRRGIEPLGLEAALASEQARLAGEEARLAKPGYQSWSHQHHSYVTRGRYAEQLERWLAHFDRDQLLVLCAEDLFARPLDVYREVLAFLELPDFDPGPMPARNAFPYGSDYAEVRASLRAYYRPHNERLYALLGRDFGWDEAPAGA